MTDSLAVVTGASSGIGFELAKQFADHGYDLLINAEDAGLTAAAERLRSTGVQVAAVQADLSTYDGVEHFYDAIVAAGRPLAAAALNAGVGQGGAFIDTDLADEINIIDLNVTSTVHLAKRLLPDMVTPGRRQNADHLVDRLHHAWFLPGRLQRLEVVPAVLCRGAAERAQGH